MKQSDAELIRKAREAIEATECVPSEYRRLGPPGFTAFEIRPEEWVYLRAYTKYPGLVTITGSNITIDVHYERIKEAIEHVTEWRNKEKQYPRDIC